jgi:hypothetical protein
MMGGLIYTNMKIPSITRRVNVSHAAIAMESALSIGVQVAAEI